MAMPDIVNLIVSNGLAVVIVGYFILKDFKTATSQLDQLAQLNALMGKIEGVLQTIQTRLKSD